MRLERAAEKNADKHAAGGHEVPRLVTMRELVQNTSKVMTELTETKQPVCVTKRGRFIAMIYPLAEDRIESSVLAHAQNFLTTPQAAPSSRPLEKVAWDHKIDISDPVRFGSPDPCK